MTTPNQEQELDYLAMAIPPSADEPHFIENFDMGASNSEEPPAYFNDIPYEGSTFTPEMEQAQNFEQTSEVKESKKGFTLAQLAGIESVDESESEKLSYAKIALFRDLKNLESSQALQQLTNSDMAAGSAPIGREELASQVLESITKESKQFVSVSINKAMNALNDKTELDPKDIPHLATDSRLLPDLLKYGEKDSIGNAFINDVRMSNGDYLLSQYRQGNFDYTVGSLAAAQAKVFEQATGETFEPKSLTTHSVFNKVVQADIEYAKETSNYTAIIKNAIVNKDYANSLNDVIYNDYKAENHGQNVTYNDYLKARIDEMNDNNELSDVKLDLKKGYEKGKTSFISTPKIDGELYKQFKTDVQHQIHNTLNNKFEGLTLLKDKKAEKTVKSDELNKDDKESENENKKQQKQEGPQQSYYGHAVYHGIRGFIAGLYDSGKKIKENTIENAHKLTEYVKGEKFQGKVDKLKSVADDLTDKAKAVSGYVAHTKTGQAVNEKIVEPAKDIANKVGKTIYDSHGRLAKAEQAIYKPTEEFAGFKVSPKLHNREFGQEIAKMNDYANAMHGALLNKKNVDLIHEKMGNFNGMFNATVRNFKESPANYQSYVNDLTVNNEAKKHAVNLLNEYQKLSLKVVSKRDFSDDLAREQAYNDLSKRSLSMTQALSKPTLELRSEMEIKAHKVYTESLFLNHYANDIENRKKLGLDTQEATRRLDRRLENIQREQMELSQMIKNANTKGVFKNADEAKISINKSLDYVRLSEDLQNMAASKSGAGAKVKDFLSKSKDGGFDLEKMAKEFMENTSKMLNNITNMFKNKQANTMGVSA